MKLLRTIFGIIIICLSPGKFTPNLVNFSGGQFFRSQFSVQIRLNSPQKANLVSFTDFWRKNSNGIHFHLGKHNFSTRAKKLKNLKKKFVNKISPISSIFWIFSIFSNFLLNKLLQNLFFTSCKHASDETLLSIFIHCNSLLLNLGGWKTADKDAYWFSLEVSLFSTISNENLQ